MPSASFDRTGAPLVWPIRYPDDARVIRSARRGLAFIRSARLAWLVSVVATLCSLGAVAGMQMAMTDMRADMAERERDLLAREALGAGRIEVVLSRAEHDSMLLRLARERAEREAEAIARTARPRSEMGAAMARKGRR